MQIRLNGEVRDVPEGLTVDTLLAHLGVKESRVAVERNLEIVPKAEYRTTPISAGDELEIVSFVGGG